MAVGRRKAGGGVRTVRVRVLLALAMLNIFVVAAGLTSLDVIASRPGATVPYPVAFAEDGAAEHAPDAPPVDPGRLADTLDDRMSDTGLGDGLSGYVADGATGDTLYDRDAGESVTPASTTKVATALSVLDSAGPDTRIATDVVADGDGRLVLVGGGDPTLTAESGPDDYPTPATLELLAESTAEELEASGADSIELRYDDTLYPGPATGPGWKDSYVWEGSVAPVHALMIDGGRENKGEHYGDRVGDPPRHAAEAFADRLRDAGVEVEGDVEPQEAPDGAETVASVSSSPVSALVERMLLESDNNIAEALVRQVAIAEGEEPSFEGGSTAVHAVLKRLGIENVHVEDGSGLSVNNRISARALSEMILTAAGPERPDLGYVLSGLPTAHFSGTLSERYGDGGGAGVVRAKTGTLNGVSTLAGTVYDADGRLLVFAFMANDEDASGRALDTLAAAVAACGCS